jgi:hypothetical protein
MKFRMKVQCKYYLFCTPLCQQLQKFLMFGGYSSYSHIFSSVVIFMQANHVCIKEYPLLQCVMSCHCLKCDVNMHVLLEK